MAPRFGVENSRCYTSISGFASADIVRSTKSRGDSDLSVKKILASSGVGVGLNPSTYGFSRITTKLRNRRFVTVFRAKVSPASRVLRCCSHTSASKLCFASSASASEAVVTCVTLKPAALSATIFWLHLMMSAITQRTLSFFFIQASRGYLLRATIQRSEKLYICYTSHELIT